MNGRTTIKLQAGESLQRNPNAPILDVVPGAKGNRTKDAAYLWIGNDADGDKFCFATVSGAATLRRLAKAILAEVG